MFSLLLPLHTYAERHPTGDNVPPRGFWLRLIQTARDSIVRHLGS
jgi:hypothetical protein